MPPVGRTGPTQTRMAESDYLIVNKIVTRGIVGLSAEKGGFRIRTQPYHPEGHGCSRKVIGTNPEITSCPDKWLNILPKFAGLKGRLHLPELLIVAVGEIAVKCANKDDGNGQKHANSQKGFSNNVHFSVVNFGNSSRKDRKERNENRKSMFRG